MKKKKINIYYPEGNTTLMYLPVFLADRKGLFSTLLSEAKIELIAAKGDQGAIEAMSKTNNSTELNECAIAIADPNAIRCDKNDRVFGVLIHKLAFWAVSRNDVTLTKADKNDFQKVRFYNNTLITGNMLGQKVSDFLEKALRTKINHELIEKVGDEFKDIENLSKDTLILTTDLLRVAQYHKTDSSNRIYINHSFAENNINSTITPLYLTTALITSSDCIEQNELEFSKIIEAIQMARAFIDSSEEMTKEIINSMDLVDENEKNKENIVQFIVNTIRRIQFYPKDMNISEGQWSSSIQDTEKKFSTFVNNNIVINAEISIAQQFGVVANETFRNEINKVVKEKEEMINELNKEIQKLNKGTKSAIWVWIKKNWKLEVVIVSFFIFLLTLLVGYISESQWLNDIHKWITENWKWGVVAVAFLAYPLFWLICYIAKHEWAKHPIWGYGAIISFVLGVLTSLSSLLIQWANK